MKKFTIALFTLFTLGSGVMPALAETANSQTSTNIVTIEGDNNTVNQTNVVIVKSVRKTGPNRKRGRKPSKTVNVQDSLNDSVVFGDRNEVSQSNTQRIRQIRRWKRNRR